MNPQGLIADRFEIQELAGSGGMATVYRAQDLMTGCPVALKILTAAEGASRGRFALEASFLAELSHPAIVRYVSHGVTPSGQCYIAMEWLEGETLSDRLKRSGLTVAETVQLITRVAQALAVAHERGVVHRDVKPSNIYLAHQDVAQAKIVDFGIARLGNPTQALTRTGLMVGTPGYMAPEQARGERRIDARADVFSLGCVFFHCLTGRPTFVADNPVALLAKVLLDEVPPVHTLRADVPAELEGVLRKMVAKEPSQRFKNAGQVVEALSGLGEIGPTAPAPAAPGVGELTESENRLLCIVLARPLNPKDGHPPSPEFASPEGQHTPVLASSDVTVKIRPVPWLRNFRTMVESFGGSLEVLANGSLVVVISGTDTATDLAARGVRCALASRALMRDSQMSVAMGRGALSGKFSLGEVLDRASRMLDRCPTSSSEERPIALDDVTAGLIDSRFVVTGDGQGFLVLGERDHLEAPRTLLGRKTPFVGRERELRNLEAVFDECAQESVSRAVLVTGPAGIGKSRLHYEFRQRIERSPTRPQVLIARGDPLKLGSPFGLIAPAIRRAARILDGEPLAIRQQKLTVRFSEHLMGEALDRVAAFLGEMVGVPFSDEDSPLLRLARRDRANMSEEIRRAWEDWLAAECQSQPLLLILEDLHWGDLPTVQLVDSALRNLRDRPLMILAVARPEIYDLFPKLWADRALVEMRLPELTAKYSEKLVRQILGDAVPPETVQQMVSLADGNAFYLEELIRTVSEKYELPDTVLVMVQARLERLEPEARRVLRAASIFGQLFWRRGIVALLGDARAIEVKEWLFELVQREVISLRADRRFPGEEDYVFRHALLREAAYSMLTEDDRTLGHQLAGEWLEQMGETEAVVLAEHYMRGKKPGAAIRWFCRAAEQALEGNDLDSALQRAERGIECGASGEELGTLWMLAAEALYWKGEYAKVEEYGEKALAQLPPQSERWCTTAGLLAEAYGRLNRSEALLRLGDTLRSCALAGSLEPALCVAMVRLARQFILRGNLSLAEQLLQAFEPLPASVLADPITTAWVEDARAVRALFLGDLGAYLEIKERVVEAYRRAGDQRSACLQRVRLGYGCALIGDFLRAAQELQGALETAKAFGVHKASALAKHNLGYALAHLGKVEEAKTLELQAVREFQAQGDVRLESASHMYLATILMLAGDLVSAEREASLSVNGSPPRSPIWAAALGTRAEVRLTLGEVSGAMDDAQAAMNVLEELGGIDDGEALVRFVYAEALYRKGDVDAARRSIQQSRDRLLERAKRISDLNLRDGFLKHVPANALTLTFAQTGEPPVRQRSPAFTANGFRS